MARYKNLSGNSGVVEYKIGDDSIEVEFVTAGAYLYTYESTGRPKIEKMKKLAVAGKGLSTFISKYVGNAYAAKLR
jgi:hypothetical protein